MKEKKELRDFLFQYISENKKTLFNKNINARTRHLCVVLEDIYQPHNASAVLRSADLFGIQDIHIIENRNSYHVNPDVALGASKWLTLNHYNEGEDNTTACLETLKSKGYRIVATTPHKDDVMLDELDITPKTALVFGTELTGLSEKALEMADAYVKIPMYGFTESFNISVSAALSMFHLSEKMRKSEIQWQLSQEEMLDIHIQWAQKVIKRSEHIIEEFKKRMG